MGILGQLIVRVDGEVRTPGPRRERHALTLLAIHRHVSSQHLIEALWPSPPRSARNSLHVAITNLRKLLGPSAITTTGPTYILADHVVVDYDRYRELSRSEEPEDWAELLRLSSRRGLDDLRDDPDIDHFTSLVARHRRYTTIRLARHYLRTENAVFALDLLEREEFDVPDDTVLRALAGEARRTVFEEGS